MCFGDFMLVFSIFENYVMNNSSFCKLLNEITGTNSKAGSTIVALGVIDRCKVVIDVDSTIGALLFTELTTHTTGFTELTGNSTLFYIVTGNCKVSGVGDHYDHILGTCYLAGLAALAGFAINNSYTVNYMDSVKLTSLNTVAVTKAAIDAVMHTITK